jgi:hypothetical protein
LILKLRAGNKRGLAVGTHVESASPHEVKLVEDTIDSSFTQYAPDKLVDDKAYGSDKLDQQLLDDRGVEMVAPRRKGRNKPKMINRSSQSTSISALPAIWSGSIIFANSGL